jgi:hypothetical protein
MKQLRRMLEMFVSGEDRSLALAGAIEGALDELMGEVEPFASVALALASYRPGGGALLYGEAEIVPMLARALQALPPEAHPMTTPTSSSDRPSRTVRELSGEVWSELFKFPEERLSWQVRNEVADVILGVLARYDGWVIENDRDLPVTPLPRQKQEDG